MFQMTLEYPPKCTQIDIFGLKIGIPSGNPENNNNFERNAFFRDLNQS
jgi:hypothetical protein